MIHDHHHHSTPNHHHEQLLMGWKQGVRIASKQAQWLHHEPNDVYHRLGTKFLFLFFVLIF
jgi:hypothetical protein